MPNCGVASKRECLKVQRCIIVRKIEYKLIYFTNNKVMHLFANILNQAKDELNKNLDTNANTNANTK